jgi:ribonuclease BN (tRNA processing enzyme)
MAQQRHSIAHSWLNGAAALLCAIGLAVIAVGSVGGAWAQPAPGGFGGGFGRGAQTGNEFIVLGTASGPNSEAARAQPANVLSVNGQLYLVDAGDGAVAQLAKAGQRLAGVRAVFLSHLHFDHTGGMFAVLGLRMQLEQRGRLVVYGPPGTQTLIDGLLAAAAPAMRAGYGVPDQGWSADTEVIELNDGDTVALDTFKVTVAENSHFSLPDGAPGPAPAISLSYRFDLTDRSVVYTGDTGPSEALVELARGADLLVSEMIDVDAVMALMRPPGAQPADPQERTGFEWHMYAHHMLPEQVGELAAAAGVKRLVITHYAPNPTGPEQARGYLEKIQKSFSGDTQLATDLGRY